MRGLGAFLTVFHAPHVYTSRVIVLGPCGACLVKEGVLVGFKESYRSVAAGLDRRPCKVEVIRLGFEGEDRACFETLLKDSNVPHSLIVQALAVEGIKVSASTVGAHRRGVCSCGIC